MTNQMKGDENKMIKDAIVPQSYKGMTLEEARVFLRSIMDLFQSLASMNDLKTMYEAGKQLSRLYFDCSNHQKELAEILLELEFPEYAIKTMKKLNNMGVFKNDDIWFSSFYFYNICWNYSDASFEFATALGLCGLPNLLNLNIGHKPYLDNLSSRNVYYLIKASLSIIHNICRYPGSCIYFRSESVKTSLLNLINREEDFIRVVASLCLASIVGENETQLLSGDIANSEEKPDVMLNIINYIRKARNSERSRFMGFRSYELLQGIRSATTVECERTHFIDCDGLSLLKESLFAKTNVTDEDLAESLEILSNLNVSGELKSKLLDSGITADVIRPLVSHENTRIRSAAQDYLWNFESDPILVDQTMSTDDIDQLKPLNVYISYASINRFSVLKIKDRLADARLVNFIEPDNRSSADDVKKAIRKCALVIICISEAFKSQPRYQLEVEYCDRLSKHIVPLLIQQKYRPDGWIQRLLDRGLNIFDLSSKRDFEISWETFTTNLKIKLKDIKLECQRKQMEVRVKQEKVEDEERQKSERNNCLEDMSRSQHLIEPLPTLMDGGYRRFNGAENNLDDCRTRAIDIVGSGTGDTVDFHSKDANSNMTSWLDKYGLGHLKTHLANFDLNLLKNYQNIKTQAPEYFYQTLEKHLKLDFIDILKFSNAIDHL